MEFRELLYRARLGDQESIMEIFEIYAEYALKKKNYLHYPILKG